MKAEDVKQRIKAALGDFNSGELTRNAIRLFDTLGYDTNRRAPFIEKTFGYFEESFLNGDTRFKKEKALTEKWKSVDLLFQLSKQEITSQLSLFEIKQVDRTVMESYLFFSIELKGESYNRTALSQITREINKVFSMPVMVLFKHGGTLTLSLINRRLHKKDEQKDVLEKVTLIKDIRFSNPHRAHIEILFDLSFDELLRHHTVTNFVELHNAWRKTLDTKELNKRFYQELSNWYFWAKDIVSFPDDVEKDADIRNSTNLIRLITRVIFVWFIKEKELVPEALFTATELRRILREFHKDKSSSSYYRAILQNLFFGTLNQKMDERGFAKDGSINVNKNEYGVKNLFRYVTLFAMEEKNAIDIFKDIPFLNGGLFDCLDKPDESGKILYIDGFSRNPNKQANVPDYLFFGEERDVDLNAIYDSRNKKYRVKGLINILSSYKFTVSENTPIEEEVALDPELLGKAFENLLASYNPETKTTARKMTGSFYTPREIVNYMVDESLKEYLKRKLLDAGDMKDEDADVALAFLFEYNEREHLFDKKQVGVLIEAIDTCKILDPACGSGAFPMGVLHKLVHILHKIDPNNEQWKERQVRNAYRFEDSAIRDHAIADIESAFANNELDYGRKLYLIENCIYGVDIQPIAVQIAKLRFFISLVVDQDKQPERENFSIRSLPNLETKFVAANTLICLDKPIQLVLRHNEIDDLEKELKDLRHRYFSAKKRREKLDCQKKDKALRKGIAELLVADGWPVESARQVTAFDPYDPNTSSPFFDPEWMFGLRDGFDVVIGNPPYIQIQKFSGKQEQKDWERQKFETYEKTGDVYCLFYERGFQILRDEGVLTFITSNKWMRANYGKSMRKFFADKTNPINLVDFENYSVFDATVNTNIIMVGKANKIAGLRAVSIKKDFNETTDIAIYLKTHGVLLKSLGDDSWFISSDEEYSLKKKIDNAGVPLKDWDISIYYGIKTGLNEAFIIDGKKKDALVAQDPKNAKILKPILLGKDIKRYCIKYENLWLINAHNGYTDECDKKIPRIDIIKNYPAIWGFFNKINNELDGQAEARYDQGAHWTNLRNCAYINEFEYPKIAWGNLALSSQFSLVKAGVYINAPSSFITPANRYLLAILNSKLGDYYIRSLGVTRSGGYMEFQPMFVGKLPVPRIPVEDQIPFEILVDFILFDKEKGINYAGFFESVIDGMVYNLYFPDEIKAAGCEVQKHLTNLPELQDDWSYERKLQVIESVYKELSDPKHPVCVAMSRMETIEEIRIIEGRE